MPSTAAICCPVPEANCTQLGVSPSLPEVRLYSSFQLALPLTLAVTLAGWAMAEPSGGLRILTLSGGKLAL